LDEIARPALFLDFDGTLVDIAASPDAIEVPGDLAGRIARLDDRLDGRVALISGRSLDDVERHLGELSWCRAGSHGVDCRRPDGKPVGREARTLPGVIGDALEAFSRAEGLVYEAKPHGGALHFRARPDAGDRARSFAADLARHHGCEVKIGKGVVELVEPGADKGAAVRAFMGLPEFAGALPIFVGDDLTDEDGIAAATTLGGFGVVVGDRQDTAARYRLGTVREVHAWLSL
jgi:trehalose 6-phosphate phosphatase